MRFRDPERDAEQNEQSQPPDDEEVRVHCIWAIEFYGPGQHEQLLDSIRRLGWDREDGMFGPDRESLAGWINRSRSSVFGAGWLNLSIITRPSDAKFALGAQRHAWLPRGYRTHTAASNRSHRR
jgi:hypothetical protein